MGDYGAANDALVKARRLFEGEQASTAVAAAQVERSEASSPKAKPVPATSPARATDKAPTQRRSVITATAHAASRAQSATTQPSATDLTTQTRALTEAGLIPHNAAAAQPAKPAAAPRSSPSLDVLAADIARRAGHDDEAVRLAELAQKRWPESHAAIDMHLQAFLTARRFVEAQTLAKQETRAEPKQSGLVVLSRAGERRPERSAAAASGDGGEVRARWRVAVGDPTIEGSARCQNRELLRSVDDFSASARFRSALQGRARAWKRTKRNGLADRRRPGSSRSRTARQPRPV